MKKENKKKLILAIFLILGGWIFYMWRKVISNNKNSCDYFSFNELMRLTRLAEGGLSSDPDDPSYSQVEHFLLTFESGWDDFDYKDPAPVGFHENNDVWYHTNKGLTFDSFVATWIQENPDYPGANPNYDINVYYEFIHSNIDEAVLSDILMRFEAINPNLNPLTMEVNNKHDYLFPLEAVMFQYLWGSGVSGGSSQIRNYYNMPSGSSIKDIIDFYTEKCNDLEKWDDGTLKTEYLADMTKRLYVLDMSIDLMKHRRDVVLPSLSTWDVHGNGWTNRCNRFIKSLEDIKACIVLKNEGKI